MMLLLLLLAALAGVLTALVIRRTTNQAALRPVRNRIYAHLLEFRLFFDEPRLIWQAQLGLLRENARLLLLLLPSFLILALPMTWLLPRLDGIYGHRPLPPGAPAVVTAQFTRPLDATDRVDLEGPAGIVVETPAIRLDLDHQAVWRIRPQGPAEGALKLTFNGREFLRAVTAGDAPTLAFPWHPDEPRLPAGDLASIAVDYPPASPAWLAWFLAVSTLAALAAGGIVK